jgi:hypothetical protein
LWHFAFALLRLGLAAFVTRLCPNFWLFTLSAAMIEIRIRLVPQHNLNNLKLASSLSHHATRLDRLQPCRK